MDNMERKDEPLPFPWEERKQEPVEQTRISRCGLLIAVGAALVGTAVIGVSCDEVNRNQAVPNVIQELPPGDISPLTVVPSLITSSEATTSERLTSSKTTKSSATSTSSSPRTSAVETTPKTSEQLDSLEIMTSPIKSISIPGINVEAPVLPYYAQKTGQLNKFGQPIYEKLNPPCCEPEVYQWVGEDIWGDKDANAELQRKRVLLGHASDIGNHLIFQDLDKVKVGQTFMLEDEAGQELTYKVFKTSRPSKAGLVNDPDVYAIPPEGEVQVVLVACLPDTASHAVVFALLVNVTE